jgi:hypothetical protein
MRETRIGGHPAASPAANPFFCIVPPVPAIQRPPVPARNGAAIVRFNQLTKCLLIKRLKTGKNQFNISRQISRRTQPSVSMKRSID